VNSCPYQDAITFFAGTWPSKSAAAGVARRPTAQAE
jgi:hypothetical protein